MKTTGILQGKWERLPGGEVAQAQASEIVIYVCRMTKTYLHIPKREGGKDDEVTMGMEQDECLLRLPAHETDIPAVVSLIASRASKRRGR